MSSRLLTVGGVTLNESQLIAQIQSFDRIFESTWSGNFEGYPMPLIIDNTLESHIMILAAFRRNMSLALIDSTLPSDQIAQLLEQLGTSNLYYFSNSTRKHFVPANENFKRIALGSVQKAPETSARRFHDPSVIVFTSGSSGIPKGVVRSWRATLSGVESRFLDRSTPLASQTFLNLQPLSWTAGLHNLLSYELGPSVVSLDPMGASLQSLIAQISSHKPTRIFLGAQLARTLNKHLSRYEGEPIESVAQLVVSGGSVYFDDLVNFRKLFPGQGTFINSYASTEAFAMMSYQMKICDLPETGAVPLGIPRDPRSIRFEPVDAFGRHEVLAASNIADGYLDQKLTRRRFKIDELGVRWWSSGDLVSFDPAKAAWFYSSRRDDLVKINDYLVSLTELEKGLLRNPNVQRATVRAFWLNDRPRLFGFVVPSNSQQASSHSIRQELSAWIPAFALPHYIIIIGEIPVSSRQKPDTQKLLTLARECIGEPELQTSRDFPLG